MNALMRSVAAAAIAGGGAVAWGQYTFTPNAYLTGGSTGQANGISGSGIATVGTGNTAAGTRAYRWTSVGSVELVPMPGGTDSYAYGVSADGTVPVGQSGSAVGPRAVRWVSLAPEYLGILNGGTYSQSVACSSNGTIVVGTSGSTAGPRAFRWVSGIGMSDLGTFTGGNQSEATDCSDDGLVVVGSSNTAASTWHPFRWTGAGMVDIGTIFPADTKAFGCAADGNTLCGYATLPGLEYRAWTWTSAAGMKDIGGIVPVFDHQKSKALAISGNGKTVAGASQTGVGGALTACVWLPYRGATTVSGLLGTAIPAGWTLTGATGVNSDGTALCGTGTNPSGGSQGWTVRIPLICGLADFGSQGGVARHDGVLDNNDFVVFINYFFTLDPRADVGRQGGLVGGDGFFDNNDFVVMIDAFFTGCV